MTFPVPMSIRSLQYWPSMKSTHTFDLAGVSAQVERYRINRRRCLVPLWSSTLLNVRNWRFTSCLQRSSSSTSTDEWNSFFKENHLKRKRREYAPRWRISRDKTRKLGKIWVLLPSADLFGMAPLAYSPGSALFYQVVASGHF